MTEITTIAQAIRYIHSVQWQGSKPGLERTRELLEKIGNPEKELKFIHVAGTNGKGSVSAMLASVLTAAGYRTGLYTSPYINRFNERIRVDGQDITDGELIRLVNFIYPYGEQMNDKPTEFELITALGMEHFRRKSCDFVVLEVGMGGELDSTNVIDPPLCGIITSIGLDHVKELGGTIEEIAKAKSGIIKNNMDVVFGGRLPEALPAIKAKCEETGSRLHMPGLAAIIERKVGLFEQEFDYLGYKNIRLKLTGKYQQENAAVALTAIDVLISKGINMPRKAIYDGLYNTAWSARFETLSRNPAFIADGGHNESGVKAVAESIIMHFGDKKPVILTGVMKDKDVCVIADILSGVAACVVAVRPDNPRALEAELLAGFFTARGIEAYSCGSIKEGIEKAVSLAKADGVVVAVGSLYMMGEIRAYFLGGKGS